MSEHPILFSGEMVKAILADRKTQTRRVIKPQPVGCNYWTVHHEDGLFDAFYPSRVKAQPALLHCPYGQAGDRLWVRETWAAISKTEDTSPLADCNMEYRADTPDPYPGEWPADEAKGNPDAPKWRPSIHMPRWASRITLEVTDVQVKRVREINNHDSWREGIPIFEDWPVELRENELSEARDMFGHLWNSINAKRGYSWESNPWVWCISFERIEL